MRDNMPFNYTPRPFLQLFAVVAVAVVVILLL